MQLAKRKLPRLDGYDYSNANHYFITICTHEKNCIFGSIDITNEFGKIAENELKNIKSHFEYVYVDKYVVMPNHIHAIIVIENVEKTPNLSTVVGSYKSGVTKTIHSYDPKLKVWQKSYYDRIIRNDEEYKKICKYIDENHHKLRCIKNGDV